MNTIEETTTLILAGDGYQLTIAPEAKARKANVLEGASRITGVTCNEQSNLASFHVRRLAELRIDVEKSRKAVKEPVNRIGKLIDQTAKKFLEDIEQEENRLKHAIGLHAAAMELERLAKLEAERKAFEDARAAREAAEIVGDESIADEALVARLQASNELAATKVAAGVRFAWDFEVDSIANVYRAAPEMVTLEIKRAAVLSWLKVLEESDADPVAAASLIGIRAFKKTVVSTR